MRTNFALNHDYAATEVDSDAARVLENCCAELAHKSTVMSEYLNLNASNSHRLDYYFVATVLLDDKTQPVSTAQRLHDSPCSDS